jgi:ATP-dependent DNA helicase RecQ
MSKLLNQAQTILQKTFALQNFRPEQADIIMELVNGKSVLALLPTGAGKSLCYQIPALMLNGVAIVISPLISLMNEQVFKLQSLNIAAYSINQNIDYETSRQIFAKLFKNEVKILYIAPERLQFLQDVLNQINISFFAVDEAHCITQWGADFRPEYLKIGEIIKNSGKPCIALTASANKQTQNDIKQHLNITGANTFLASFNRANIFYSIDNSKTHWEAWLIGKLKMHSNQSGIVYCSSRDKVEKVATFLSRHGINAVFYHANITKMRKDEIMHRFLNETNMIVVATIAFGMGIDKQAVRFVVHLDMPSNLENYYQETGRAGRDGLPSVVYFLYTLSDYIKRKRLIVQDDIDVTNKINQLNQVKLLAETSECRRANLLRYFNQDIKRCGFCDNCLKNWEIINKTQNARYLLSTIWRTDGKLSFKTMESILNGTNQAFSGLSVFGLTKNENFRPLFKELFKYQMIERKKGTYILTTKSRLLLKEQTQLLEIV